MQTNKMATAAVMAGMVLVCGAATAGVWAMFTGRSEFAYSVTGRSVIRCEYQYGNDKYWVTVRSPGSCPYQIELE